MCYRCVVGSASAFKKLTAGKPTRRLKAGRRQPSVRPYPAQAFVAEFEEPDEGLIVGLKIIHHFVHCLALNLTIDNREDDKDQHSDKADDKKIDLVPQSGRQSPPKKSG